MTQKTQGQVSVKVLLNETQNYRASLECLMELGRSLLSVPSLESSSADAFQSTAEHILEEAGHQEDLQVVDGVAEPEARIELIMQDVLVPRLTEVEQIEKSLAEKAEDEIPTPFTTRDAETAAAMESLQYRTDILDIFGENIRNVKTILSMEGMPVDVVRPMVVSIVKRAGEEAASFGVSLESVEQTQVLGEMADAVQRIEQLVEKAHETTTAQAERIRSEAEAIGSDGQDKIGDLIERHRADNPSGAHLAAGTSVTTVASDNASSDTSEEDNQLDAGDGTDEGTDGDDTGTQDDLSADEGTDNAEGADESADANLDLDNAEGGDDLAGLDDAAGAEGTGEADDTSGDAGDDVDNVDDLSGGDASDDTGSADDTSDDDLGGDDTGTDDNVEGADDVAGTDDVDNAEGTDGTEGGDDTDNQEEEEEESDNKDDNKASIESMVAPVTIEQADYRIGDEADQIRGHVLNLLTLLNQNEMLTEAGQAALSNIQANEGNNFVLTSDMFTDRAAEVLIRHYDTWIAAAFRDGEANLRGMSILLDS